MPIGRHLTALYLVLMAIASAQAAIVQHPKISRTPCDDAAGNAIDCASASQGKLKIVSSPASVISVWGGARKGIALKSDGTVWVWGVGILGAGTGESHTPVQVHGPGDVGYLNSITAIMGGEMHNFALKSDGTVWSWGGNTYMGLAGNLFYGLLGDGTNAMLSNFPVQVSGLISVTSLGGRGYHSLAVKSDGTVWAWGSNIYGQLGIGTITDGSNVPVQVIGVTNPLTVTGGGFFSLALMPDHTLRAWGNNDWGQLGDGTYISRSLPISISGLSNAVQVSAGWKHAVALEADGTVWTWGRNNWGELGNGMTSTIGISMPIQVGGLSNVIAVSAGDCHTTALKSDGTVWAWGCNNGSKGVGNFELGDGTNIERHTPVQVVGLSNVTAIAARDYHNYAIKSDGSVWAWGWNVNGQLGDGTTIDRNVPVRVLFSAPMFLPLIQR